VRDVTVVGKSAAQAQLDGAPPTQGRATQIPSSCTLREFLVARDPAENRRPAGYPGIATDTAKAFPIEERLGQVAKHQIGDAIAGKGFA
jgi:hypothetical protein